MQTAVLAVGPDGRIDRINPAAEALLNISAPHLKGRMLSDVLTLPRAFDPGAEGPFAAYDVMVATARGGRMMVDMEATSLPDHPGWRLIAFHGSALSHQVGHRLDRAGATRAAVGVAAMLAHEIKNPLSGIRGAAQLIEGRASDDDRKLTRLIRTEVDRVAKLLDQMEGFTDTRPVTVVPENIHEIIDHARNVAKQGFGAGLKIADAYDPSLPPVLAHRDSLIQILLNLLKNAAEAGEGERRQVRITTAYRQGVSVVEDRSGRKIALPIELCVIDNGPGVPPEIADDLFEPFVSSKKAGRGLGLALADKLVRDMGGVIQYSREGDPPMTVFRLLLPRAERIRK
jgi:two-component system nitrogen regulation sensor histidine kinase GlnL